MGTVPCGGKITVDGTPTLGVFVTLYDKDNKIVDAIPVPHTNENGDFTFSMYKIGDGIPAGTYKVTFEWCKIKRGDASGPDKLSGRYSDPEKSEFTLDLQPGKPQTKLSYALTTK